MRPIDANKLEEKVREYFKEKITCVYTRLTL